MLISLETKGRKAAESASVSNGEEPLEECPEKAQTEGLEEHNYLLPVFQSSMNQIKLQFRLELGRANSFFFANTVHIRALAKHADRKSSS